MSETRLRLAFAGTPDIAARLLRAILDSGRHTVHKVYTQPDRRAGRGQTLRASPVKELAVAEGIPVEQPQSAEVMDPDGWLAGMDVLLVVAYGLILPPRILGLPRLGSINVHMSLLPRWRGAAPIARAVEAGDRETGVTIMQMDAGLDTGDILAQQGMEIRPDDTAASLEERLAECAGPCLAAALDAVAAGTATVVPQDASKATYADKLSREEARIDWSLPAATIERRVRAFDPAPVASTRLNGTEMKVWRAQVLDGDAGGAAPGRVVGFSGQGIDVACGSGILRILRLQLPGKRIVSAHDFHIGHPGFMQS